MVKRLLIIGLLLVGVVSGATIDVYVDPGATGTADGNSWDNAYTALQTAVQAREQDLTDNGGDVIVFHTKSSTGANDSTPVVLDSGWTTSPTCYVEIRGYDFPSNGVWDDDAYILEGNDVDILSPDINDVKISKIQILAETDGGNVRGICPGCTASTQKHYIDSCIIKGVCAGGGKGYGITWSATDSNAVADVYNCIIYGFVSGGDTDFAGIFAYDTSAVNVWNCTIYGNYYGIRQATGTVTAKNCAVGNATDDFAGTVTMDYIVSDDDHSGDCSNYWSNPTAGADDWSSDFTTPGSNFRLLATATDLIDDGVADLFNEDDDIMDTARPQGSGWDIGAYEYSAGGGGGPNLIKRWIYFGKKGERK